MKHTIAYFLSLVAACSLTYSCSPTESNDALPTAISFVADYAGGTQMLKWKHGDQIGLFEKHTNQALNSTSVLRGTFNTPYRTIGNQVFTAVQHPLTYPKDGQGVDFVAYAPYNDTLSGLQILVDIRHQSDLTARPLLYADNLRNRTQTEQPTLRFRQALAKVHLTFSSSDGRSIHGLEAAACDLPLQGQWHLATGQVTAYGQQRGNVAIVLQDGVQERQADLWLVPGQNITLKLRLVVGKADTLYTTVVENTHFNANQSYHYRVAVKGGKDAESGEQPVQHGYYTETPLLTVQQLQQPNLRYIEHHFTDGQRKVRNYELLYDTQLKMAYWVSYPLCNYYTRKRVERTNAWAFDPSLARDLQANLHSGVRGYDRGHQIPSADRLVNREANEQTFYFTNMTPQFGALNKFVWADLEQKVRAWSSNIDTLYVVTGAIPPASDGKFVSDNSRQRMAVPVEYYKALCKINRATGQATTIGFLFKNQYYSQNEPIMNHAVSVQELERRTGFVFFPTISSGYKTTFDKALWR